MARRQEFSIDRLEVRTLASLDYQQPIEVGVDGTGYDFKFYGDTASAYALWDYSADMFILEGADLKVNDNDNILFGDATAGDAKIGWSGSFLYCSPVTGFWAGCPSQAYPDPSVAYFYMEDFIGFPLDSSNEPSIGWEWWDDAGATTAEAAGELGGVLLISTNTGTDQACGMMLGRLGTETVLEYTKDSGLKSWVEFRVKFGTKTNNINAFIGLIEENANTDNFINDAGNDFADVDLVGFVIWEADGDAVDAVHQKNGTAFVDVGLAKAVNLDWHTYGLYFDGVETITWYADGTAVGTADLDTASFPTGEELIPVIYLKNGAADMTVSIDWLKMVIER